MNKLSIRENDIELRTCNDSLGLNGEHTTAEIVRWTKDCSGEQFCHAIASWRKGSEGYYMVFVGGRPANLSAAGVKIFWRLYRRGQKFLDRDFDMCEN